MIGRQIVTGCRNVLLLLTCSSWGRFQELELKLLKPLPPPQVFTYIECGLGVSGKDVCSIGNACMWHLGWRVKLSELQALPSPIVPTGMVIF